MLLVPPSASDAAYTSIKTEYSQKMVEYPLINAMFIPVGVYVTQQQYVLWTEISPYLPLGAKLSRAYVRPDDQALNGLITLKTVNPAYPFDTAIAKKTGIGTPSVDKRGGSDFFTASPTIPSVQIEKSDVTRTHPNLNGKFDSYYLHQFDYETIQSGLLAAGITWALPYEDSYQKGLTLDIDLSNTTVDAASVVAFIDSILKSNTYLNAVGCVLSGTIATITFSTSTIPVKSYEFGILNVGSASNVADCFSQKTLNKIYANLKVNGYGDLDETVPPAALRGLPRSARKKGSSLAKAIRDSLIDVLGGSEGIISVLQGTTNEYLMGIINGLLASNSVLYDELDRIGGGGVKQKALDAFESGMVRATVSKNVESLLKNGMDINNSTGKALIASEAPEVVLANSKAITSDLKLARELDATASTQSKS